MTGKIGIGIGIAKKGLGLLGKVVNKATKSKSDFSLKNQIKKIKKTPNKVFRQDKTYKLDSPATVSSKGGGNPRTHGKIIKGSKGKKDYVNDWKRYHHKSRQMAGLK